MKSTRGLALAAFAAVASFAFPAVASASGGFVADQYTATLQGTPTSTITVAVNGAGNVCPGQPFSTSLSKPAETVSASPTTVSGCTNASAPEFKSCNLEFHPGSSTIDIGPAGCGPAKFYVGDCKMSVPAQTGIPAIYGATGSGSSSGVSVEVGAKKIKYSTSAFSLGCGAAGSHENGELFTKWEITGTNAKSESIGVYSTTGSLPVGVFMNGSNTNEELGLPYFGAQIFPVKMTAERGASESELVLFKRLGPVLTCSALGASKVAAASSEIVFDEFTGCKYFGYPVTLVPNSCHYGIGSLQHSGEPGVGSYEGEVKISCAKEGDMFEFVAEGCTVKFPAQQLGGGLRTAELTNSGKSVSETVGISAASTTLHYKKTGGLCWAFSGNGEDGIFNAKLTMHGTYAG